MRLLSRPLAALAMLSGVTVANALIIDDFTSGAYSITANSVLPNVEAVRTGSMLGGERDVLLQFLNGPTFITSTVQIGGGGASFYNEGSESTGILTLQYDGFDGELEDGVLNNGTGLGANFSGFNQFELFFPFIDGGLGNMIQLTITVMSNTGTASYTSGIMNGTNILHTVGFSNFAGVNFAQVQNLTFTFTTSQASDFTLDYIAVGNSIPGPAALVPFVAGLGAMMRRRRRI